MPAQGPGVMNFSLPAHAGASYTWYWQDVSAECTGKIVFTLKVK